MKVFVLILFIPSIITAHILCPNSKTTCPEDKYCCEVNGEYSCCDPDGDQDVQDIRKKVYPGVQMKSPMAFGNETVLKSGLCVYCRGTCCGDVCCQDYLAVCCNGNECCPSSSKCCPNGCCRYDQNCCPNGCCEAGYTVCCRSWCCLDGYSCGSKYQSCISKGSTMYPEITVLLLFAASVFVSRHL